MRRWSAKIRWLLAISTVVALLTSLVRLAPVTGQVLRAADSSSWSDRYVVILPGIQPMISGAGLLTGQACTAFGQQRKAPSTYADGFSDLISKVRAAHPGYKIVYFSYRVRWNCPNTTSYYASDTHQHLDTSANELQSQLEAIVHTDARATFDLVAHSLGGVVAAYWAVHVAHDDLLQRVHGLITFDSPLSGIKSPSADIGAIFSGPVWADLTAFSSPIKAIDDAKSGLVARLSLPADRYSISTSAPDGSVFTNNNRVYTISNTLDQLIGPIDSQLGGARADEVISVCPGLDISGECHGSVLHDAKSLLWAMDFIDTTIGSSSSLDLALVIDTTSSMQPYITNVKASARAITGEILGNSRQPYRRRGLQRLPDCTLRCANGLPLSRWAAVHLEYKCRGCRDKRPRCRRGSGQFGKPLLRSAPCYPDGSLRRPRRRDQYRRLETRSQKVHSLYD